MITNSADVDNYTVLQLQGEGNAGANNNTFLDSSPNAFTITRNGDTTQGTFSPYGNNWSNFFDSASANYLTAPDNAVYSFGTGDFTVECWICLTTLGRYQGIWTNGNAAAGSFTFYITNTNQLRVDYYGGAGFAGATTLTAGTWYHVAVSRNGTTNRIFLNGVQDATNTSSFNNSSNRSAVGLTFANDTSAPMYNGYISNLRVVKGTALYTSTFTPSTTPLTAIAGTSLLTCQSNRFIDNSSVAAAITVTGALKVQRFSPFSPGNAYAIELPLGTDASVYFNGSGSYLTYSSPVNTVRDWWVGNYTCEAWIYPTTLANWSNNGSSIRPGVIGNMTPDNDTTYWAFGINGANGEVQFYYYNGAAISVASGLFVNVNQWNHIAFTKTSSGITFFCNGVKSASTIAISGTPLSSAATPITIGSVRGTSVAGYISNVRINYGTALYTSTFTPPTSPLTAVSGTSLLTCQGPSIKDSSTNAATITTTGGPSLQRLNPFNSNTTPDYLYSFPVSVDRSVYFNGSTDYLSYTEPASATPTPFTFLSNSTGTGTFECWVYPISSSQGANAYDMPPIVAVGSTYMSFGVTTTNKLRFYWYTGTGNSLESTGSVPFNTWTHVAFVRNGSTVTLYVNGVSSGSTAFTGWSWSSGVAGSTIYFGYTAPLGSPRYLNGYISNARVINGTALYTSAFTPPTAPLTAVSGTSLLTCQGTSIKDNSTNAATITATGTPTVRRLSPFSSTAAYRTNAFTSIAGSAYFDGSGDYLTAPSNAAFAFGTGDFTIEAYINLSATGSQDGVLIELRNSGPTINGFVFDTRTSGSGYILNFYTNGAANLGSIVMPFNAWNHVAITRSGSTVRMFSNGLVAATITNSANFSDTPNPTIGQSNLYSSSNITGYMSDVRIIKGTAVYTSNFTPPTAPLTTISGTSLLCNFTNGAIFDSAMMNDLQTVGNAQISTSVVKYGTGSIAFDGSTSYLSTNVGTNDLYVFGSGDFTIEMWIYFNSVTTEQCLYDSRPSNTQGVYPVLYLATNGTIRFWVSSADRITSSALSVSTWYHVALSRSGTSTRLFINGTQSGSTYTDSNVYLNAAPTVSTSGRPWIGRYSLSQAGTLNGYIDDLRITKGYARYTSNFTPPTALAPVTLQRVLSYGPEWVKDVHNAHHGKLVPGDSSNISLQTWTGLQNLISKSVDAGQTFSSVISSTYSLVYTTANGQYYGGVLAPNGDVHFVPYNATRGQKISTSGVVSSYLLAYQASYVGGALAPNGDIHFAPNGAAAVGQKVSISGVVSTYSLVVTGGLMYAGGVVAPNGDLHFVPVYATVGQKVSAAGVVSTYSLVYTGSNLYYGGVLAPNGDIHFVPASANRGQKVSAAGVVSTYSLVYTGGGLYQGGVLAPNGDIHFVPYGAAVGQKISASGVVSTYSLVYTTNVAAYNGGVLAPNGDIHFIPQRATVGQRVSAAGVVSTYSLVYTISDGYVGGVLAPNGDIHFIPYFGRIGLRIHTGSAVPFDIGTCCSPFLNKY
jgi:hypothetical protein